MIRLRWWGFPLLLSGCSLLVDLDRDDFVGEVSGVGATGSGGEDNATGGQILGGMGGMGGETGGSETGGEGGLPESGGTGGDPSGGSGGTGGKATGGTGGDPSGGSGGTSTGGQPLSLSHPHYHYRLNEAAIENSGFNGDVPGTASDDGNWQSGAGIDLMGAYDLGYQDYLEFDASVASSSSFSVSFWMNPVRLDNYRLILCKWGTSNENGFEVYQNNGRMQVRLNGATEPFTAGEVDGGPEVVVLNKNAGSWYHVVMTYTSTYEGGTLDRVELYVDGVLVIRRTDQMGDSGSNETSALRFGYASGVTSAEEQFIGIVDDLRVYEDWVLSPEEVTTLFEEFALD